MLFATTWMNPEGTMPSEIHQTEKDKYLTISPIVQNLKQNWTHRYREQIGGCQRRGGRWWVKWVKVVKVIKKKKSWNSLWKVRTQMARWLVLGPVLPTPPGCVSRPTAALTCDPWAFHSCNPNCLMLTSDIMLLLSCYVASDSLWPHELQPVRIPCPPFSPGVCSDSCPLHRWCQPTTWFSATPFSSCPHYFPASESFQMRWLFTSGGQSVGVSASASGVSLNIQGWFPLGWTGWISLQSKGLSRVFSNTTVQKHQFLSTQLSLQSNSHIHTWLLKK